MHVDINLLIATTTSCATSACMQIANLSSLAMHIWTHACISHCQGSKPNMSSSPAFPKDPNEPVMNPRLLGDDGKLPAPWPQAMSPPPVPPGQHSAGADPTTVADEAIPADPTTAASSPAGAELLLCTSSLPQR
jgi:hypothetical protein